jgi:hypothetical protein
MQGEKASPPPFSKQAICSKGLQTMPTESYLNLQKLVESTLFPMSFQHKKKSM